MGDKAEDLKKGENDVEAQGQEKGKDGKGKSAGKGKGGVGGGMEDWGEPLTITIPPQLADIARQMYSHRQRFRGQLGGGRNTSRGRSCNKGQGKDGNCGGRMSAKKGGKNGKNCKSNSPNKMKGKGKGKGMKGDKSDKVNDSEIEIEAEIKDLQQVQNVAPAGKNVTTVVAQKAPADEGTKKGDVIRVDQAKEVQYNNKTKAANAAQESTEEAADDNEERLPEWIRDRIAMLKARGDDLPPWMRKLIRDIDTGDDAEEQTAKKPDQKEDVKKVDVKKDDGEKDEDNGDEEEGNAPNFGLRDIFQMIGFNEEEQEQFTEKGNKLKAKIQKHAKKLKDLAVKHQEKMREREARRSASPARRGRPAQRGFGGRGRGRGRGRNNFGTMDMNQANVNDLPPWARRLIGALAQFGDVEADLTVTHRETETGRNAATPAANNAADDTKLSEEELQQLGLEGGDLTQEELMQLAAMVHGEEKTDPETEDMDKDEKKKK